MNPTTTLTNHNPPATHQCGLNPGPNCREESDTPQSPPDSSTTETPTTALSTEPPDTCCRFSTVQFLVDNSALQSLKGNPGSS